MRVLWKQGTFFILRRINGLSKTLKHKLLHSR